MFVSQSCSVLRGTHKGGDDLLGLDTYMCHYSSVQSEVSWCKSGGNGTALADPATAGAIAPEKSALPDIISDVLYSKISWQFSYSIKLLV